MGDWSSNGEAGEEAEDGPEETSEEGEGWAEGAEHCWLWKDGRGPEALGIRILRCGARSSKAASAVFPGPSLPMMREL